MPWPPPIHRDDDTLLGYPNRISESYLEERQNWTPTWQKYSYWSLAPALLFGTLLVALFAFNIHEQREFATRQQVTTSSILRIEQRDRHLVYAYSVYGQAHGGIGSYRGTPPPIGKVLTVYYDRSNPSDSRLGDGSKATYTPALFMGIALFAMYSIAALRIRTHRRERAYRFYLYSLTTRVPPPPRPR